MQSMKHIPELKTSSVELRKDCQPRFAGGQLGGQLAGQLSQKCDARGSHYDAQ